MNETANDMNKIIIKILLNDNAKPPLPTPIPINEGKKGIKKTNKRNANLSLYEIIKKYALIANVNTVPKYYPLKLACF